MQITESKRYEIAEVFGMIGEGDLLRRDSRLKKSKDIEVDGFMVHPISLRYMTFYQKGTTCVCCGKVGTHFRLCGEEATTRRHFNLFADDGTLITKDHILPKSKGGEDKDSGCLQCGRTEQAAILRRHHQNVCGDHRQGDPPYPPSPCVVLFCRARGISESS